MVVVAMRMAHMRSSLRGLELTCDHSCWRCAESTRFATVVDDVGPLMRRAAGGRSWCCSTRCCPMYPPLCVGSCPVKTWKNGKETRGITWQGAGETQPHALSRQNRHVWEEERFNNSRQEPDASTGGSEQQSFPHVDYMYPSSLESIAMRVKRTLLRNQNVHAQSPVTEKPRPSRIL